MLNQPVDTLLNTLAADGLGQKVVLVLFHNDLRLNDNATLQSAAQLASSTDGRLILAYAQGLLNTRNQNNWSQAYYFDDMGAARQQFLLESLADLDQSLQRLGNRLLYLKNSHLNLESESESESDSFSQLCQLIEAQQVTDICISQTADYAQNQAYQALQTKYAQIKWHSHATTTLFAVMPTEDLPPSFTQFRKKVEDQHNLLTAAKDIAISPTPTALPPLPEAMITSTATNKQWFFDPQSSVTQIFDHQASAEFIGGESNAILHLNTYFDSDAPSTYKTTRNALDEWTHSTKFSAWLANGTLSVKVLLNRLRQYEREVIANGSTYWIWFELLWREYFYWYAVVHQKNLFLLQGIAQHKPTTTFNNKRLVQWQNGQTAYPIVNACMKQLNHTGYMSNRGRQIVASCFIHELGLDWRYGATYFEQQLIDYDVGSNWGNWQYLAGVGADPRGCRQFNLKKQSQQHDPKNEFIDKWT